MNTLHNNKITVFEKKHKASDFTFYNGYIQIENYVLESVKIIEVPSYLLNDIDYEFTIVQETRRLDHFHFEPYSDLSILLNAVEGVLGRYMDMIKKERDKDWNDQLAMKVVPFLLFNREKTDDKYKLKREQQFDFVTDVLIETSNISSEEISSCFNLNFDCDIFKVPLDDIDVFDGYVNVNTKNIEFVQDVSWEAFCKYLIYCKKIHLLEKLGVDICREQFETAKLAILQSKRDYKEIKIKTFLTKKSFNEVFMNKWLENPVRSIYQSPKWYQPRYLSFPFHYSNEEENDGRYILSKIPLFKLREIFSSELFSFSSKVLEKYDERLSSLVSYLDKIPFWVKKDIANLRISRPFHESYMNAIFGTNRFIKDSIYYILFQENCHHVFDEYSEGGRIESHYCYLIFDIEENHIILEPKNSKYSSYTFYLYPGADIMVAACFILKYFTSFETNKRQRLTIDNLWNHFGIASCRK